MNLIEFADRYGLKLHRDVDGTLVVQGRTGQIYEMNDRELAVMFIVPNGGEPRPRAWKRMTGNCQAVGMKERQMGDAEGSFSFDPENRKQAKLALKVAGVLQKRQLSDGQRRILAARLANARQCRSNVNKDGLPEPINGPETVRPGEGTCLSVDRL